MLVPYFYSRPCGRGDQCEGTPLFFATYFYSRPCGRGDKISVNGLAVDAISTHAPAGGATIHIPERNGVVRRISTHAPAGGATRDTLVWAGIKKYFYSRPCGRGDPCLAHRTQPPGRISTHAPAGGATSTDFKFFLKSCYFYSRPCGRGDGRASSSSGLNGYLFLLTPLREGRRSAAKGHE